MGAEVRQEVVEAVECDRENLREMLHMQSRAARAGGYELPE